MKICIVGGVAGGASLAARLRRNDEHAEIIMFERDEHISFANCGLPYYISGVIENEGDLILQTPQSFKNRFNVDVRVRHEVIAIDSEKHEITVQNHLSHTVYVETYDDLVLSPGAKPIIPTLKDTDLSGIFSIRNVADIVSVKEYIEDEKPKSALVVGGGYIGIEMAENLYHAGIEVSIVELQDHVIAPLDYDMACELHKHLRELGVNLLLNKGVTAIRKFENQLIATLTDQELSTDMIILAVGVKPDTDFAIKSGIEVNQRGCIKTNQNFETNLKDVYAIGDAIEVQDFMQNQKVFIPLAGPANKQGRMLADVLKGAQGTYRGTQGSSILKCFDLTVACTGMNERIAKAANINYEKSFTISASHASYYPDAQSMSIKTLFEKETGKLLGVQIIGKEGVDKRCDVFATALRANFTVFDLCELELCYAPPFSSAKDPINMAGFVASNILQDKVKVYHWHDIPQLNTGEVVFLDVRTTQEFANGSIPNSINIPIDELRTRFNEIPANKSLYINCQSGQRSYLACRMLSQKGWECFNLSGGYRLYALINAE